MSEAIRICYKCVRFRSDYNTGSISCRCHGFYPDRPHTMPKSCRNEDVFNALADYDIDNDPSGYNNMKPEDIAKDWIDYEDDTEVLVVRDNGIRCHYSINIF